MRLRLRLQDLEQQLKATDEEKSRLEQQLKAVDEEKARLAELVGAKEDEKSKVQWSLGEHVTWLAQANNRYGNVNQSIAIRIEGFTSWKSS